MKPKDKDGNYPTGGKTYEYEKEHMEKRYSSRNPLVRYFFNKRIEILLNYIPTHKGQRILDAGCGEGHLLKQLYERSPYNEYYGIDLFDSKVKETSERCGYVNTFKMDILNLKFPNDYFDVVVCESTLEHIPNYFNAIRELERVLKEGGVLLITFPNEFMLIVANKLMGRSPAKPPDHYNSFFPSVFEKLSALKLRDMRTIPFNLPFMISLECIMVFK